jgi:hypothetical protein
MTAPADDAVGLRYRIGVLTDAIALVTDAPHGSRELDAVVLQALGWRARQEHRDRGLVWRCCGPHAVTWLPMPAPTTEIDAARDVVPHGHSWQAGVVDGHPAAWVAPPRRTTHSCGTCTHVSVPLALCKASLLAHRVLLMRAVKQEAA